MVAIRISCSRGLDGYICWNRILPILLSFVDGIYSGVSFGTVCYPRHTGRVFNVWLHYASRGVYIRGDLKRGVEFYRWRCLCQCGEDIVYYDAYNYESISQFNSGHGALGFAYNETLTNRYYNENLKHRVNWNITGRFVLSKDISYANLTNNNFAHLIYTNHTTHLSIALAADESINDVLVAPVGSIVCLNTNTCPGSGDPPGQSGDTVTWISFNLYGYNGDDQWDGHGIMEAAAQLGGADCGLGNYFDDNGVSSIGKWCAAASLTGCQPGIGSIIVGELYINAYGGIDSQCDSF
jgi:hypothetical protein